MLAAIEVPGYFFGADGPVVQSEDEIWRPALKWSARPFDQ
jgi:hypothetical protein